MIYHPHVQYEFYYFGGVVVYSKMHNILRYAEILVGQLPDLPHWFRRPWYMCITLNICVQEYVDT